MAIYYAAPSATSGTGTINDPWELQTALNQTLTGDTVYLRGGTYLGKYLSSASGGTFRSYPGEWAVIDGNYTTTLNGSITSGSTSLTLTDASRVLVGGVSEIWIDNEVITCYAKSGNTITSLDRNAEGTTGGAAAHSNGATVRLVANHQLNVSGTNRTFRDFEVKHSSTTRTDIYQKMRGLGIVNTGTGNSFINLRVHDTVTGIFMGSSSEDILLYGILSYNNGMRTMAPYGSPPNEPRGGNYYLESAAGFSRVYECLSLDGFTFNGQLFGVTGPYVGGDIQGSVFAHSGGHVAGDVPDYFPNFYVGTGSQLIPSVTINESHFWMPDTANTGNATVGYGAGVQTPTFTNNYCIGSATALEVTQYATSGTITGNKISAKSGMRYVNLGVTSGYGSFTWDNNTYYADANNWTITGIGSRTFTQWKADTGWDASSTMPSTALPTTVIVRPNAYETGRANVIIYAAGQTSVNVNLATTGLVNGQPYVIKNAFDWDGGDVVSGAYNADSTTISVPLNGNAGNVAEPTGLGFEAVTTAPDFVALVVVPLDIGSGTSAIASGGVTLSNGSLK